MRILVTGAAGFIGRHVVARLLARGYRVRALLGPEDDRENTPVSSCETAQGDLLDPNTLLRPLRGCDVVIHAAGRVSLRFQDRARLALSNIEGTRRLLNAMQACGVPRLVHISSASVLGSLSKPECLDESHPGPDATTPTQTYVRTKYLAENIAFAAREQGLQVVSVLPGMVWGPGDIRFSSIGYARDCLQKGIIYSASRSGTNLVDVEDVAEGICLAMKKGRDGQRYLLGGENLTAETLCRRIVEVVGPPARCCVLPPWLVTAVAGLNEALSRLGLERELGLDHSRLFGRYWWFSWAKAEFELGYRPAYSSQNTLLRTVDWLRARTTDGSRSPAV